MQSLLESSLYHSLLTGNSLSLFYLSIISIRTVLAEEMLIADTVHTNSEILIVKSG